jgi:glycosyltransferase involved in cell wall biosynthesis
MDYRVILTAPRWHLSGVNTFSANLARQLRSSGIDAEILLTAAESDELGPAALPDDVPVETLPIPLNASWRRRWSELLAVLQSRAPCVYLPNYDFDCAGIVPALPGNVVAVGIAHSDEAAYYDLIEQHGASWNAVVAVSQRIEQRLKESLPELSDRIRTIPYGVSLPELAITRDANACGPLRLIFAGRLDQPQKRVLDLAALMDHLESLGGGCSLEIVGSGPEESELRRRCARHLETGSVRFSGSLPHHLALERFSHADAVVLTSAFEGLPLTLLEAMARGCVPVITDFRSGAPEVVRHQSSGLIAPVGDMASLAQQVVQIRDDRALRNRLSASAAHSVVEAGCTVESMADRYRALFEQTLADARRGSFNRPQGKIAVPPHLTWSRVMTGRVRCAAGARLQAITRTAAHFLPSPWWPAKV